MQTVQVSKWGNSLGVRIPKGVAEDLDIRSGDSFIMESSDTEMILRKPASMAPLRLAAVLDCFAPTTQHPELSWGISQGKEVW